MNDDEIVLKVPGGKNGVLAKLNPQWFTEIQEVDESIFVSIDELFRKTRAELKELREKMQPMALTIQSSNNAVARFRFSSQLQMLDVWENWLDSPLHESFDAVQGYKLFEWIKQRGDVPITSDLLNQAHARLKAPELVPEAEMPPTIITQPKSVEAAPLELITFSVGVSGSKPMEYQWLIATAVSKQPFEETQLLEGLQLIPGEDAMRPNYRTAASEFNDGAVFLCRISNKFGQVISLPARLTMRK